MAGRGPPSGHAGMPRRGGRPGWSERGIGWAASGCSVDGRCLCRSGQALHPSLSQEDMATGCRRQGAHLALPCHPTPLLCMGFGRSPGGFWGARSLARHPRACHPQCEDSPESPSEPPKCTRPTSKGPAASPFPSLPHPFSPAPSLGFLPHGRLLLLLLTIPSCPRASRPGQGGSGWGLQ